MLIPQVRLIDQLKKQEFKGVIYQLGFDSGSEKFESDHLRI